MTLTPQQILEMRKKYNIGSAPSTSSAPQTTNINAESRINALQSGTYSPPSKDSFSSATSVNQQNKEVVPPVSTPTKKGGNGLFSDMYGMVKDFGTSMVKSVGERKQTVQESQKALDAGEQGKLRTLGQVVGNFGGLIGDAFGNAAGAVFHYLPTEVQTGIKEKAKQGFSAVKDAYLAGLEREKQKSPEIRQQMDKVISDVKNTFGEIQNDPVKKRDFDALLGATNFIGLGEAANIIAPLKQPIKEAITGVGGFAEKELSKVAAETVTNLVTNAQKNLANNLNKAFSKATVGVKKISDFAEEKGINLGEEIVKMEIPHTVSNERLKFDPNAFDKVDNVITQKSNIVDEAIKAYPDTRIKAEDVLKQVKEQIKKDPQLIREGRVQEVIDGATAKLSDFVNQPGRNGANDFTLAEIQDFKKGMWSASKKFKMTEIGKSDAYSELGKAFRKTVEMEVPDANINAINQEIGKAEEVYKLLDKVNSLQDGGIVLQGGKLGKHFSSIFGGTVGAYVGSLIGGAPGALVGAVGGGKLSSVIRNISQKSSILGPLDSVLIKYATREGESTAIKEARAFIDAIKAGKKPTITPSVQKTLEDNLKRAYYEELNMSLMLEKSNIEAKLKAGQEAYKNATPATIPVPPVDSSQVAIPMGQIDTSVGRLVPAKKLLPQRNPKTGRMGTVYSSQP